jgi:hypothetical protein
VVDAWLSIRGAFGSGGRSPTSSYVTAPSDADDTSRAYFAITPVT